MLLNIETINKISFEKVMRGYNPATVDKFVSDTKETVISLAKENKEIENKLIILANKIEEYRWQEDSLKSALINAQRLGDNVVYEANQKADRIAQEQNTKFQILNDAIDTKRKDEEEHLRVLEKEILSFKSNILGIYQQHIQALSALDNHVQNTNARVFPDEVIVEEDIELAEESTLKNLIDNKNDGLELAEAHQINNYDMQE